MRIESSPFAAGGVVGPAAAALDRSRPHRPWAGLPALLHCAPFAAVAAIYEGLRRAAPSLDTVRVAELFLWEERLFSVRTPSGPRLLSELIASHTSPLLDLVCGVTYLLWIPEVLVLTLLLFLRRHQQALELAWGFLVVNLAGWGIWLMFPAAPPWYVDLYGLGPPVIDVPASAAGLARLDELVHLSVAAALYSKNAYVFGAMPSLHMAYAALAASVAFPLGGRWRAVTLGMAFSMAFSAIYLRHHYLLDVIAGAVLALAVSWLVRAVLRRWPGPAEAA